MPPDELTAEEQSQLDQMRADDAAPVETEPAAAPAQPEPPADPPAEDDPAPPAADKRPQMVPHAALHEERERRKEVDRALAEERKARQTLEERTNLLLQNIQQRQPPPAPAQPELPDYTQDPAGHIVAVQQQQARVLNDVIQAITARAQQDQQTQGITATQQRALAMEQQFARDTPDYVQAVDHLSTTRHRQLQAAGWEDAAERQAIISREALGVAERALQMGRNPASVIYDIAKEYGFTGAAPTPTASDTPAAPQPNGAEKLQQLERGQQQARSLGNARGAGPAPLTAQRLLELDDKEFAKMMETTAGLELLGT